MAYALNIFDTEIVQRAIYLKAPTDRCPYELAAFCPQRELTNATRELGDVRMTVCRSTLVSDRGEMDSARFLLNFSMERGVEKREPGERAKGFLIGSLLTFPSTKHYRL